MAKIDEKVMSLVEAELEKNPDATVDELYDESVATSPSIGKLSKRQFNARYPLQVKRRKGRAADAAEAAAKPKARKQRAPGRPKATAAAGGNRQALRDVFLRFASDLVGAEQRKDLVKVLAGVDEYVDSAIDAAGKK